jgi:hypothetical protein
MRSGRWAFEAELDERRVRVMLMDMLRRYQPSIVPFAQTAGLGSPGVDVIVCAAGRFVAIEVKRPGNKPTPRQKYTLDKVTAAGGKSFVVDSAEAVRKLEAELQEMLNIHSADKNTYL